jgi:hypothetical protein
MLGDVLDGLIVTAESIVAIVGILFCLYGWMAVLTP